jgi:hypothetical protein
MSILVETQEVETQDQPAEMAAETLLAAAIRELEIREEAKETFVKLPIYTTELTAEKLEQLQPNAQLVDAIGAPWRKVQPPRGASASAAETSMLAAILKLPTELTAILKGTETMELADKEVASLVRREARFHLATLGQGVTTATKSRARLRAPTESPSCCRRRGK